MEKKRWLKRSMSIMLAIVLSIGLMQVSPAYASDTDIVFVSCSENDSSNIYATTEVTNDCPGNWTYYLPTDAESGVFAGNSTSPLANVGIYKLSSTYYCIGNLGITAQTGDIFAVKGTFSYGSNSFTVAEQRFRKTSGGWEIYAPVQTVDMSNETFTVNTNVGDDGIIYLTANDYSALGQWQNYTSVGDSGIWLGDVKLTSTPVARDGAGLYYIGRFENSQTAQSGDELKIKGTFYDSTTKVEFVLPEMYFRFNGTNWEKFVPDTSLYFSVSADSSSENLYVVADKANDCVGNWTPYTPADDNSGIWKNGNTQITSMSGGVEFFKVSSNPELYCIGSLGDYQAVAGDFITIKGMFQNSSGQSFTVTKQSFQYDGATWVTFDGIADVTFSLGSSETGNTGLNLQGAPTNVFASGWSEVYKADISDTESGIWLEDDRLENTGITKVTDTVYYVGAFENGISAAEGNILTIKGTFVNGMAAFSTEEIKLQWNGSCWVNYVEIVYTDVNISSFSSADYNSGSNVWNFYFGMSVDMPISSTNAWDPFSNTSVLIGSTEIDATVQTGGLSTVLNVSCAADDSLLAEPAEGTLLTIKAGKYISSVLPDKGINLLEDFSIVYTDGAWQKADTTEYTKLYTGTLTYEALEGVNHATDLYFTGSDSLDEAFSDILGEGEVWNQTYLKVAVGTNNGVFVNGVKTSFLQFQKVHGGINRWYLKLAEAAVPNETILTIKGDFTHADSQTKITFEEMQFLYTESGWVAYVPITIVDLTDVTLTVYNLNSTSNIIYLTSSVSPTVLNIWDNHVADAEDTNSGVWLKTTTGETKITDCAIGWSGSDYYIGAFSPAATAGDVLTIRGTFSSSNNTSIIVPEMKLQYTSEGWIPYSDIKGDYTFDHKLDSRDLVRLKKYLRSADTKISAEAEYNEDNEFNNADVDDLRWALVFGYTYDSNGIALGLPGYSDKKQLESMAYSAPAVGTWEDGSTVWSYGQETFTKYEDSDIDAAFQKYKSAGLTLLDSTGVGTLVNMGNYLTDEYNEPFRVFMEAAERNDMRVLVNIGYIDDLRWAYRYDETAWTNSYESNYDTVIYNQVYNILVNYPAFAGVIISDEWYAGEAEIYENVLAALKRAEEALKKEGKLDKDLIYTTSQLPVSAYDVEEIDSTTSTSGLAALTGDASSGASKEEAYKTYINKFGSNTNRFVFDLYPLIYSEEKFFGYTTDSKYSVNEEWFDNLKWVAETARDNQIAHTGITIQSCKLAGTDSKWSKYERYAPEEEADIGFQVYTALAYGMKEIHYFTYNDHAVDSTVCESMIDNGNVYAAVQKVNSEIRKFDHVLQNFKWKGTLDLAANSSENGASANSSRLASATTSAGSARTFVGCMKDIYGFDGYMVANAAGPRTTVASNIILTFENADKAIVYKDGVKTEQTLTNNALTLEVPVGEGIFVIPVKSN